MRVAYTELLANHISSSVGYTFQMRVVYTSVKMVRQFLMLDIPFK